MDPTADCRKIREGFWRAIIQRIKRARFLAGPTIWFAAPLCWPMEIRTILFQRLGHVLGHYIGDIRYRRSDNPSHQLTLSEKWTGKAQNGDQFLSKNSMANVQILFKIASAFSVYKQQKSMTAEEIRNITFEHSRQQRQFERAQGKKVGSRFFTS